MGVRIGGGSDLGFQTLDEGVRRGGGSDLGSQTLDEGVRRGSGSLSFHLSGYEIVSEALGCKVWVMVSVRHNSDRPWQQ